jgi:hypothetical protein
LMDRNVFVPSLYLKMMIQYDGIWFHPTLVYFRNRGEKKSWEKPFVAIPATNKTNKQKTVLLFHYIND